MPKTKTCPKCSTSVPLHSRFCQGCGAEVDSAGPSLPARTASQWMVFAAGALAIVVVVGAALMFIGKGKPDERPAAVSGKEIAGAGPMPSWLTTADPNVVAEYAWAAEHFEELQYIPCYCGCDSVGHTGNASCYFRWDKNGKILGYDAHALG